jgi:hypothetical protein
VSSVSKPTRNSQNIVSVLRLSTRVLDPGLRQAIVNFAYLCA